MIKPQLCEKQTEPFNHPNWIWETKYDGARIIATTGKGDFQLQARSGTDKTRLFPELHLETKMPAILDGEVVCDEFNERASKGYPAGFNGIQHRINRQNNIERASKEYPAGFRVFDVLQVGDQNVEQLPLAKRKQILRALVIPTDNVRVALYYTDGIVMFNQAKANHMEGIVGKCLTAGYHRDKRDWIKVKVPQLGHFFIVGYTQGTGWRTSSFGALVLAKIKDNSFSYVGSVGTGFNEDEIGRICRKIKALGGARCPFLTEPECATWLSQPIEVLVEYLEITKDGRLRFPSYKGML